MSTTPDTDHQDSITCPHCGIVDTASWEYLGNGYDEEQVINCGDCHQPMTMTIHCEITYTTQKTTGEADPLRVQRDLDIAAGCIYRGALATCHATGCPVHSPATA